MAEQDRYGSHLSTQPTNPIPDSPSVNLGNLPKGAGAEQDRYGGWFGGKKVPVDEAAAKAKEAADKVADKLPVGSGAEQDRYGGWFGGKKVPVDEAAAKAKEATDKLGSGAEQDRYGGWFGGKKVPVDEAAAKAKEATDKLGSGAEQDRYSGWFGGKTLPVDKADERRLGPGAEQDRYGSHFSLGPKNPVEATPGQSSSWSVRNMTSGAEQDRYGSHFATRPDNPINATAVGLLKSTILPSFGLQSGLAVIAYGASRFTDRAEGKDWLWPSGQVINAWWSALGSRVFNDGLSLSQAWSTITYPEKLLLGGVSAWGIRLFYHIASRSVARGEDDARYIADKKDPGFWNKAFFSMFMPEAVVQTLIALPFTLPFRAPVSSADALPLPPYSELVRALAVFLFSSGFALEVLADTQLAAHREKSSDLNREGVWSIVRHPNYLGDTYVHASFPMLLYSAGILHPLALIGPVVNYAFLRYVGGDKQNEASQVERYQKDSPLKYQQLQEYRREKNSFWPKLQELQNPWHWVVFGAGAAGVVVELGVRRFLR